MEGQIYTVSEVNGFIKNVIDGIPQLSGIYIRGELSNYKIYPSGHHYFTLKDGEGALRCVMFKGSAMKLRFRPENGMQVIAYGRISVFPRDGAYQLYCSQLSPDGVGDLYVAFEQLKDKLYREGLFDEGHKKPLPRYPQRIAIVTSSAGAAIHDMIRILRRRYPIARVILLPVRVQGAEAPPEIVGAIAITLEREGYRVLRAYDGMEALDLALDPAVRLILIDVMMPKLDGLSALLRIREKRNLPVIVLSAKSEDTDKILGLSMGADDYVTKPFNPQELAARVRSQLRRYTLLGDVHAEERQGLIVNGRLTYDPDRRELRADGEAVKLTATETKIVDLLMRNPGRIFPAEEIYRRVWDGEAAYACENTVMVHIRRIREKIELNPKEPDYIKVVWGIGYKIEKR